MKKLLSSLVWSCGLFLASSSTCPAQVYNLAQDVLDAISDESGSLDSLDQIEMAAGMDVADINDDGWVVGDIGVGGELRQLFVWTPGDSINRQGDDLYPESRVYLLTSALKLDAVAISNTGTVLYNFESTSTADGSTVNVGAYRRFEDESYSAAVGTEGLIMRDISESWIAADFIVTEDFNICSFQIDDIFVETTFTRAYAFNIAGGQGVAFNRPVGFNVALTCNLSSRAYAIKATSDNQLLYVAGESFGLGQGESRLVDARGMLYSRNAAGNFTTTEVLDGDPGQVRAVNSFGNYTGAWFTSRIGQFPNSLRAFYTGSGCLDELGLPAPYVDLLPDRNAQGNGINDAEWVVGTFRVRDTSRAFLYQPLGCTDADPPPFDESGNFEETDLSTSFKDLTEYARQQVGLNQWKLLGPGQSINDNMQVVGNRGIDPQGNERPYLVNLSECEDLPAQDVIAKGVFEPVEQEELVHYVNYLEFFDKMMTEAPYRNHLNTREELDDLFEDNDDVEGALSNQGWYVNETVNFGPDNGQQVLLATNLDPGYRNNARHEILSKRILIFGNAFPDAGVPEPIPQPNDKMNEAYICFKTWAHQENGPYDFVKIEARIWGDDDDSWQPIAYVHYTTGEDEWTDYVMDVSDYLGQDIQLRFQFISDQCEEGDGVLFKDFELARVSQETQHALFADFLNDATEDDVVQEIEDLVDDPEIKLGYLVGGAGLVRAPTAVSTSIAGSQLGVTKGLAVLGGVSVGPLLLAGAVTFGVTYQYLNTELPVSTIIFSAPDEAFRADPNLGPWIEGKRRVFFNGMSQLTTNVPQKIRAAYYAAALNGLLEVEQAALDGATNGDPAYVRSFTSARTKDISLVIPTELGAVMDINNQRMMFKRLFSELALTSSELNMSIYVYDTYEDAYYEVTLDNGDYFNAFRHALHALHWADEIVSLKTIPRRRNPTQDPSDPTRRTVPNEVPVVDISNIEELDDEECNSSPNINPQNPRDPEPEEEPFPIPIPIKLRTKTLDPCGEYIVAVTRRGQVSQKQSDGTSSDPKPIVECRGMISPPSYFQCIQNPNERARNLNTNSDPAKKSTNIYSVLFPWMQSDGTIIENPEADHYLDGTEITLELKDDFTFVTGNYSSSIDEADLIRLGLAPEIRRVEFVDRDPAEEGTQFVIDNIIYQGDDLAPGNSNPYFLLPQDGRYNIEVCARHDPSGEFLLDDQNNHIVSSLLHKIETDGSQSVLPDVGELDDFNNVAIFMPGYSSDSYLINDANQRLYQHEDLRYTEPVLFGIGEQDLEFFDRWDFGGDFNLPEWDTYVWQSPAFLEPGRFDFAPSDADRIPRIFERFFALQLPNGVSWFDTFKKDNRNNNFDDVANNPTPTTGLVDKDTDYLERIMEQMIGLPDDFPIPGRVLALYGENISGIRALLAAHDVLTLDEVGVYDELRLVIGLLDPVWPLEINGFDEQGTPETKLTNELLTEIIEDLSQFPNVTVFVAHSQTPTLQSELGVGPSSWLNNTLEYDLSVLDQDREGNPQLLLKFIHALGAESYIDLAHCRLFELPEAQTTVLGETDDGETCYSTFNPNINEEAFSGYMGPNCDLQREYFQLIERQTIEGSTIRVKLRDSYKLKAEDFTNGSNIFRLIRDENDAQLARWVLKVVNATDEYQQFLDEIISTEGTDGG